MAAYKGVVLPADYTFVKGAAGVGTITFSANYTGIALSDIMYVTNVKSTIARVIYDPSNTTLGGTLAGLVLTLAADTASMDNSDPLQIIVGLSSLPIKVDASGLDNTSLYSGTLSTVVAGTAINTTGYQSVVLQVGGAWNGSFWIEGSLDGTTWCELMLLNLDEFSMQDAINSPGMYQLKTSAKFIRYNVLQLLVGSITLTILGRTSTGVSAADLLSFAMDRTQNMPLYTEEIGGPLKRDASKALIQSDAPAPLIINGIVTANQQVFIIDTTGYQSIAVQVLTTLSSTMSLQTSNDGLVWSSVYGISNSSGGTIVGINQAFTYSFPVIGKYFRGVSNGTVLYSLMIYLRNTPFQNFSITGATTNLQYINGSAPSSQVLSTAAGAGSSTSGSLVVGSNVSNGSTIVPMPIMIGGREAPSLGALSGKVRTLLLDTDGATLLGGLPAAAGVSNVKSVPVTNMDQLEGQSQIEIMALMLLELRLISKQLSTIPNRIFTGVNDATALSTYRDTLSTLNI